MNEQRRRLHRQIGQFVFVCSITAAVVMGAMQLFYKPAHAGTVTVTNKQATDAYNKHVIDSAVSLLRSGNIVLRTGLGADSYLLAQMNRKDQTYSHCGIVMIENGYPFVYHSIGGEDNPDERLRRDSAVFFFSPLHNLGLAVLNYDYGDSGLSRLTAIVNQYYKDRPKFDLKFDLKTDDKLYCAEFVYKAVNRAMNDRQYLKPTVISGFSFVGIDDLFVNDHAHFIWQIKFK